MDGASRSNVDGVAAEPRGFSPRECSARAARLQPARTIGPSRVVSARANVLPEPRGFSPRECSK